MRDSLVSVHFIVEKLGFNYIIGMYIVTTRNSTSQRLTQGHSFFTLSSELLEVRHNPLRFAVHKENLMWMRSQGTG